MPKVRMNLEVKLGQKLLITPQMRQSLKMLQMPYTELIAEVNQIMEENPVIEQTEIEESYEKDVEDIFLKELQKVDWQDYFSDPAEYTSYIPSDDEDINFDKFIGKKESLYEHLRFQLNILGLDEVRRSVGEFIVGNIDDNGYFCLLPQDVADELGVDEGLVREVLEIIREFEPAGVGSSTLKECILKQMENMGADSFELDIADKIISSFSSEIKGENISYISEKLEIDKEYIEDVVRMIKRTDPKPGLKYARESRFVVPDVYIVKKNNAYEVVLNEDEMPAVKLNKYYLKMLKNGSLDKTTKEYMEDKVKNALWFLKSMNQRKKAIIQVVEYLVKHQTDFFEKGFDCLKPLKLKDVAESTGLHESTVSRVTSNKYAMCKYGVIELKSLFIKGLVNSEGDSVATSQIKNTISQIISSESKDKPYADQKIVEILSKKGIKIARRTVAKYREEMSIPGTSERKKRGGNL